MPCSTSIAQIGLQTIANAWEVQYMPTGARGSLLYLNYMQVYILKTQPCKSMEISKIHPKLRGFRSSSPRETVNDKSMSHPVWSQESSECFEAKTELFPTEKYSLLNCFPWWYIFPWHSESLGLMETAPKAALNIKEHPEGSDNVPLLLNPRRKPRKCLNITQLPHQVS
jgi:hypothetical protein